MADIKQTNGVTAPQAAEATAPVSAPAEATKPATPTNGTTAPAPAKKAKLTDRIIAKLKSLMPKKEKTTTSPAAPTPAVTTKDATEPANTATEPANTVTEPATTAVPANTTTA